MTLSKPDPARAASPRYGASGMPLAASVDISAKAPPVGNQGPHQSCVGWAVGYYAKTWFEKTEHPAWNISQQSNQMSPQYLWNGINGGRDTGTSIDSALKYLQANGCADWEEFPYNGDPTSLPSAEAVESAKQFKIPRDWGYFFCEGSWTIPPRGDVITRLKSWLNSGKPLVLGLPIYDDFPGYDGNPHNSYYLHSNGSAFVGGHAGFIAGYNDNANPYGADANSRGGFLMVNSWGPSWNGNGKVYLSYDFVQRYVPEAWFFNDSDSSPTMSSMSPSGAGAGQIVTITGNNFGARRRSARVAFQGSSTPQYVSWANNQIKVRVPSSAHSGYVYVYDWESEKTAGRVFSMGNASYAGANWLLAEGSTWPGYDEWVLLQNPNSQSSSVSVAFLTPAGAVKGPTVNVSPMSRTSIHVNDYVPNADVSTAITVKSGANVCAERAMYFSAADGKWGSHDSIAAPGVSDVWYLAEGATCPGFDEWILVMNPFEYRVTSSITFQTPDGDVPGPTLDLAPNSRQSVLVNHYVPDRDVSATVRCLTPGYGIVAERSMYFNSPDGKIDCHNSMGADETASVWGLAEGATWPGYEEWVLVQNPTTTDASVTLFFLTPSGIAKGPTAEVLPGRRVSFRVNDYKANSDVSTMVQTADESQKVVVEQSMYVSSGDGKRGATNAPGSAYASKDWLLTEGCTNPGFDEWVLVMNPNRNTATVHLTFMTPTGELAGPSAQVPANGRVSFHVNDYVAGDVSTRVTADYYVVAERAMYINSPQGKGGATCSLGVVASTLGGTAGGGAAPDSELLQRH